MNKKRFAPPVIQTKERPATNELVFPPREEHANDPAERFVRFFPGTAPAANQAPTRSDQPASPLAQAPELAGDPPAPPPQEDHQAKLEAIFEQAAQEGFEAGLTQAQEQTQTRIDEHMRHMEAMLRTIVDLRRSLFESYQEQCLEVALAGAEALARRAFQHDKEVLRTLIQEALSELNEDSLIRLHVCEANAAELSLWVEERFPDRQVQVIAQADMKEEDFRAVSKTGSVTGDFQERLSTLRQAVFQHRGRWQEQEKEQV